MTVETNRELKQRRRQRQRKHLGEDDYSMFASSSHLLLLTEHAANGLDWRHYSK